ESLSYHYGDLIKFYQTAIFYPYKFFDSTLFKGNPQRSVAFIAATFFIGHILTSLQVAYYSMLGTSDIEFLLQVTLGVAGWVVLSTGMSVLFTLGLAFALDGLHNVIGSDATTSEYLRFFAFASLLFLLGQILTAITGGFAAPLIFILLLAWSIIGMLR